MESSLWWMENVEQKQLEYAGNLIVADTKPCIKKKLCPNWVYLDMKGKQIGPEKLAQSVKVVCDDWAWEMK